MAKRRLLWQIFPAYTLIIIIAILVATWYSSTQLRKSYLQQNATDLKARATLFREYYSTEASSEQVDVICNRLGKLSDTRFTVIMPDGTVIGDTTKSPDKMDNHGNRPEIISALKGEVGMEVRYSASLRQNMMYLAIPITEDGSIKGVVRASISITSIEEALHTINKRILLSGFIILVISVIVSLIISRRISKPIEELTLGAMRYAEGKLDKRIPVADSKEISVLAEATNKMAEQLNERIASVSKERNEKEAVLSSMIEGVIAIDKEKKVIHLNHAAARFLNAQPDKVHGRFILEIVRNSELENFICAALEKEDYHEEEFQLREENKTLLLQARSTSLCDQQNNRVGALIVLNDITHLRRLENARRDFVANVSHELRTPVTSVKGFLETLLDGALEDKDDTKRFIEIALRHTDRLNAIIDDLLELSRIERDEEDHDIELENAELRAVIMAAVQTCSTKAGEKNIELDTNCPDELETDINSQLMEAAIANLIDNAIKYSEQNSRIIIEAVKKKSEIHISVTDSGCGISKEHMQRIFERFYRVDKARSSKLGGTGLGLALVKHIVQAHHGAVEVQSEFGKGSTFTISLPRRSSCHA